MCGACDAKDYELLHLHKEVVRLITEKHFLNVEVDNLLTANRALHSANAGLHGAVVRAERQMIVSKTGAM